MISRCAQPTNGGPKDEVELEEAHITTNEKSNPEVNRVTIASNGKSIKQNWMNIIIDFFQLK